MRKSLLSLITFVLVLANLALTAILTFKILPQTESANELISKVCEAIELDIASSDSNESSVPVDQMETLDIIPSDSTLTVNLKLDDDGVAHYAVLSCTLTMNMQSTAYGTYGETISNYQSKIQAIIQDVISSKTYTEVLSDQQSVKDEIKDKINALFGASDFIVSVDFPSINYQ